MPRGPRSTPLREIENINDRVHAQAALSEAEERFRRAFNDAPIGMGLVALDGRWLRVNQRLTEITGFSGAQLLASTFQDITHPDDVDIDVEHSRQLLAGEVRSYQMEKRYVRPDGESIWVMLSVSLVRGMDDEPLYFISQVENINERKRVERELTRLAEHDSLTGLLNRRRFQQELERERKRARRSSRPRRDPVHRHRPLQAGQRHARPQGRRRRPPVDREETRPPPARHRHHRPSRR